MQCGTVFLHRGIKYQQGRGGLRRILCPTPTICLAAKRTRWTKADSSRPHTKDRERDTSGSKAHVGHAAHHAATRASGGSTAKAPLVTAGYLPLGLGPPTVDQAPVRRATKGVRAAQARKRQRGRPHAAMQRDGTEPRNWAPPISRPESPNEGPKDGRAGKTTSQLSTCTSCGGAR